jgi:predicted nucleic acid-binding protein
MRVALDTNVLAYAEGLGDEARRHMASELIAKLHPTQMVVPVQVLCELSRVLTSKLKKSSADARQLLLSWSDAVIVAETTWTAFQSAMDLTVDNQISMWDALIVSVAAENKCRLLISEDFQNGFTWRGVNVVNPFEIKVKPYKLLASAIKLTCRP